MAWHENQFDNKTRTRVCFETRLLAGTCLSESVLEDSERKTL